MPKKTKQEQTTTDNIISIKFSDPHEEPVKIIAYINATMCEHAVAVVAAELCRDFEITDFFITLGKTLEETIQESAENN